MVLFLSIATVAIVNSKEKKFYTHTHTHTLVF